MASGDEPELNSAEAAPPEPDATEMRHRLVEFLVREGAIRHPALERAFSQVPREFFLPADVPLAKVYSDEAIAVRWDEQRQATSSSSQPYLMADMLETLETEPGMRVLEIGAGVGYNAALLAHLLGDGALVTSLDFDPVMADYARQNLQRLGDCLDPSYGRVTVVAADGGLGYAANAPYDRIIVTVQQWEIAPAWVEQLKPGGLLLLPLTISARLRNGLLPAFRKDADGVLRAVGASQGSFVPMQGQLAHPVRGQRGLTPLPLDPAQVWPEEVANFAPDSHLYLGGGDLPPGVQEFLSQADLLTPTKTDGLPLELLRAMASPLRPTPALKTPSEGYYSLEIALAASLKDQVWPLLLGQSLPPELNGDGVERKRYEPRGLAVLEAYEGGLDLVLVFRFGPPSWTLKTQEWRFGPVVASSTGGDNRAWAKLAEGFGSWRAMHEPRPGDYRPLAYPADRPAPLPGLVVPRRYYNILLPFTPVTNRAEPDLDHEEGNS